MNASLLNFLKYSQYCYPIHLIRKISEQYIQNHCHFSLISLNIVVCNSVISQSFHYNDYHVQDMLQRQHRHEPPILLIVTGLEEECNWLMAATTPHVLQIHYKWLLHVLHGLHTALLSVERTGISITHVQITFPEWVITSLLVAQIELLSQSSRTFFPFIRAREPNPNHTPCSGTLKGNSRESIGSLLLRLFHVKYN